MVMRARPDPDQPAYPVTYQPQLSPAWLGHVATFAGVRHPDWQRPFRYLELGCGSGFSSLVHAASFPRGEFFACDVDAAQMARARAWARRFGVRNVTFQVASFDDPLLRTPGCYDIIAAHGVYSWVPAPLRAAIRDLLHDTLSPGGLAYLSYNCLPGWVCELPLRRLLGELADAAAGGKADVRAAAEHVDRLCSSRPAWFTAHPAAALAVASWRRQPVGYLAAEYLGTVCDPFWSVDVADQLAAAGLDYLASADLVDHHDPLLFDDTVAQGIEALPSPRLRALGRDFAVYRTIRRDVFVRREGRLTSDPAAAGRVFIGSAGDPGEIPEAVSVPRGVVRFQPDFVATVRSALVHGALTLDDAVTRVAAGGARAAVTRNLLWMLAGGALTLYAQPGVDEPAVAGEAAASSRAMLRAVAAGELPGWVPSRVRGGGVAVSPAEAAARLASRGHRPIS